MTSIALIPAKYKPEVVIPQEIMEQLPERLMLFASVQFLHHLNNVATQLETAGKTTFTSESKNFLYDGMITPKGQLLGCNMEKFDATKDQEHFDAFLYIGDGVFHPKALLVNNRKDVFCYDPKLQKLKKLPLELYDELHKRNRGNLMLFLQATHIGVLVTTKRGQNSSKRVEKLKELVKNRWPDKKLYIFIANEINFLELENFNFIQVYINSACSRIGHDDTTRSPIPIVNIEDIEDMAKAE